MKRGRNIFISVSIHGVFLMHLMPCKAHISADVMATMGLPYIAAYYKEIAEKTAAGGIGLAGLTLGLWLDKKIEAMIDESTQKDRVAMEHVAQKLEKVKGLQKEAEELQEEINTISEAIDKRISQLLEEEYIPRFELFCTPKSKIFVLQNIHDFFEIQNKYVALNALIYEVCIKKINELERQEMLEINEYILGFDKSINSARDDYIEQYGVSIKQLHGMTLAMVSEKIKLVEQEIDRLEWELTNATQNNINALALISILGHLKYIEKHKIKENYEEYNLEQIFEQEEYDKHLDVIEKVLKAKKVAQQRWLAMRNKEQQAYVISPEKNKKAIEKKYNLVLQQSLFSKIRAYFASLWYGNK